MHATVQLRLPSQYMAATLYFCTSTFAHSSDRACKQVGTEKLILTGRLRIALKPLIDDLPVVAAIQVLLLRMLLKACVTGMSSYRSLGPRSLGFAKRPLPCGQHNLLLLLRPMQANDLAISQLCSRQEVKKAAFPCVSFAAPSTIACRWHLWRCHHSV